MMILYTLMCLENRRYFKIGLYAAVFAVCALTACSQDTAPVKWGSFTSDRTYSYDEKYYAVQSVERFGEPRMVKVSVYRTDTGEPVDEFSPARAWDFWGICWESDTYNIWIQSSDIGIQCYAYEDGSWVWDGSAERPSDIISKYETPAQLP